MKKSTILAVLLLLLSCGKESEGITDINGNGPGDNEEKVYKPIQLKAQILIDDGIDVKTRAYNFQPTQIVEADSLSKRTIGENGETIISPIIQTRADDSSIQDVNLYFFHKQTDFKYHYYGNSLLKDMDLIEGDYSVYIFANYGKDLGDVTSTVLSSLTLNDSILTSNGPHIMSSREDITLDLSPDGTVLHKSFAVKRRISKIEFSFELNDRYRNNVSDMTLQICNLPKKGYLFQRSSAPSQLPADYYDTDPTKLGNTYSTIFTMFENNQGVMDGVFVRNPWYCPKFATHILIEGNYKEGDIDKNFKYTLYFGQNQSTDFNVKANARYTYEATLDEIPIYEAGDYFFSDHTYGPDLVDGKTPVGVFYTDKEVVSLHQKWGKAFSDYNNTFCDLIISKRGSTTDYDGYNNTKEQIKHSLSLGENLSKSWPYFYESTLYSTDGTTPGDWVIPASGQALMMAKVKKIIDGKMDILIKAGYPGTYINPTLTSTISKYNYNMFYLYFNSINSYGLEPLSNTLTTGNCRFVYILGAD